MTYRADSDFYTPYGRIVQNVEHPKTKELSELSELIKDFAEKEKNKIVGKKTKAIAWFVSNCDTPSNRMEYVKALQKHIQVDIFGQCGHLKASNIRNFERPTEKRQILNFPPVSIKNNRPENSPITTFIDNFFTVDVSDILIRAP
jgi:hypothetical protein